jgi:predicted nucleic acid-binding protein
VAADSSPSRSHRQRGVASHRHHQHCWIGTFKKLADLPGDFADLTLVSISERLDVAEILTLDSDFDVYRRFRKQPFCRIPLC